MARINNKDLFFPAGLVVHGFDFYMLCQHFSLNQLKQIMFYFILIVYPWVGIFLKGGGAMTLE